MQVVAARTHEDGTATSRVLYELKSAHGSDVSWMHDLAVTDQYLVLVEQPLVYNLKARPPPVLPPTALSCTPPRLGMHVSRLTVRSLRRECGSACVLLRRR